MVEEEEEPGRKKKKKKKKKKEEKEEEVEEEKEEEVVVPSCGRSSECCRSTGTGKITGLIRMVPRRLDGSRGAIT